ncbi:type VII secretion target [Nocardia sp. NPDC059764]|uniref:type VII secretion target n=1 Tax=Nocardia sp. NPDC059764 TaxID=3346939 RepID=UPI00364C996D
MHISIHPDGLTTYATATTALATRLTTAATHATTAAPTTLADTLGLIGADLLTAYARAHATHTATLAHLTTLFTSTSAAAETAATTYTDHDHTRAAALRTATELDA